MISSYLMAAGILCIAVPAMLFAVRPWPWARGKSLSALAQRRFIPWPNRQAP